jgi:hypothetical protein
MIKKVIRKNLPETNSSSSHSVVISMDSGGILEKEEWDLDIDDKGVLHIPSFTDFGREFFRTNSVLIKLQYLSCHYICGLYKNRGVFSKRVHKFKTVLKDILGINGIIFEDYVNYYKDLKDGRIESGDENYYEFPTVDHNSQDIFDEITESKETIKNFLLNKNTWLYGGSDECREDKKVYINTELEPPIIGCFSADLGGDIGRVDVEVTENNIGDELGFFAKFEKTSSGKWVLKSSSDFSLFTTWTKLEVENGKLVLLHHGSYKDKSPWMELNFELYDYGLFSI